MEPKILILDEPTAGLDPHGRDEILGEIRNIFKEKGITIILVSHSMEDVARLADRMVVMHQGKIAMDGTPREIFRHEKELKEIGLGVPQVTTFMNALKERGANVNTDCITVEEARQELLRYLKEGNHA